MYLQKLQIKWGVLAATFFIFTALTVQSQIQIQGLINQNEGAAAWNADGSGPEPYGNGHGSFMYYAASCDYVNPASTAGAHVLSVGNDFPLFALALTDNGFTPAQVRIKMALASLGDDLEGVDWFFMENEDYLNFYPFSLTLTLDEEPLISGTANYIIFQYGVSTGYQWFCESNFFIPVNASGGSSSAVQAVASAFLQDVGDQELRIMFETFGTSVNFSSNGRSGVYYNFTGSFEKGLPEIRLLGLHADNEGAAGWDANGTGPEPYGNGHSNFLYYCASVDYDDINPSPDAALCHLLDVEKGFQNTILQLQYRGFEIGDIKIKMGLASFGPDVEGEDWGMENGYPWLNEYNNLFTFELNGEPILQLLCDTNKMVTYTNYYSSHSSIGKLDDISQNASVEAQYVALSFLKDIGTHFLEVNTGQMHSAGSFTGNGRNGGFYSINEASLVALHEKATFLQEGTLSGNLNLDGSPYYIEGHQWIENGQTLTIEPGVRIGVRGPYHFDVQGRLKAEGTPDHVITFTSSNPNLWWDGIDFDETPVENDTSLFNHCIFQYALAQGTAAQYNSGGAMAIRNVDKIKIQNSIFRHNKATLPAGIYPPCGGAIAFENSDLLIHKCTFYNNTAKYGGAVHCYLGSDATISRCLFYNNTAESDAGAIQIWDNCKPAIFNNTFSINNAGNNGGAIDVFSFSNPGFGNNIFWGNEAVTDGQQISISSNDCPVAITYCDVQGGESGIGPFGIQTPGVYENNIDADPLFVDITNFNFLLDNVTPSPCINAGDPTSPPDPDSSRSDMGCYQQDISTGLNDQHNFGMSAEIFPNPFTENLTISFEIKNTSEVTIEIFNAIGEKVEIISQSNLQPGKHTLTWQNALLPEGIYFLRLQTGTGSFIQKIVKTK